MTKEKGAGSNEPAPLFLFVKRLADIFAPIFKVLLYLCHKLPGVRAIDGAMVEAQSEADDAADRNRIGTIFICNYGWFFEEPADVENCALRLIDDRGAELLAEDSGIGDGKGARSYLFRLQLLGARTFRKIGDGARDAEKAFFFRLANDGTISPHSRATAMPMLMFWL